MMSVTRNSLLKVLFRRSIHTSRATLIDAKQVEEVRIPVPWGHVAGRWWGSREVQPVLCLHGWMDNAGSWEPLLRLLPSDLSFLALDFPGSGLSSHLPPFQQYHFVDSALVVHLVKNHFRFEPLTVLGHSGGSATALVYSAVYPDHVAGYFGIDYVLYAYADHTVRAKTLGKTLDKNIELSLREPSEGKGHTWEEAKRIWVEATLGSVSEASAEILMRRGTREIGDGKLVFSRDNRLKTSLVEASSVRQVESLVDNLTCHVSLVKALKSPLFDKGIKNCPHILDKIKKRAKSYEYHEIDGGHHLHMDMPEAVLPLFLNFLGRVKSS